MLRPTYPLWLANRPRPGSRELPVTDKFSGDVATRVALAGARGDRGGDRRGRPRRGADAELAAFERAEVLAHCARRFQEREAELADGALHRGGQADPRQPRRGRRGSSTRSGSRAREATRIRGEVLRWT
jgi:hypothetical protein